MKLLTWAWLAVSVSFFLPASGLACSSHPGMTHEQWTSAIAAEKDKNGGEATLTKDFWEKKNYKKPDSNEPKRRGASQRKGSSESDGSERKIREVQ